MWVALLCPFDSGLASDCTLSLKRSRTLTVSPTQRPRDSRLDATAPEVPIDDPTIGSIRNVAGMAVAPYAVTMGESGPSNACGHA